MAKLFKSRLSQPYLRYPYYLKIEPGLDSQNDFLDFLTQNLPIFISRHPDFQSIEVEFNPDWTSISALLQKLKFFPSLHSLRLKLESTPPSPLLPSPKISFNQIINLLHYTADYHYSLYPQYYLSSSEINASEYEKYYYFDLRSPRAINFLTYSPDLKPTGFIYGQKVRQHAEIYELVIHPDFQKQHLGRQLLNQFIQTCQNLNLQYVMVGTGHNQPALNFYLHLGFSIKSVTYFLPLSN